MFRVFENIKSKNYSTSFNDVDDIIQYISGVNNNYIKEIKALRNLVKGSDESDRIKASLPAVIWNFKTNGKRTNESAIESTGFIYFDIDNNDNYTFNKDYFYSYWRSCTGTGYGSIVKVSGVNKTNFKEAFDIIAKSLSIPFDPKTKEITKLNILSYDPEIYHNKEAEIFDMHYLNNCESTTIEEKCHTVSQKLFFNSGLLHDSLPKLRYNNLEELLQKFSITYDENGICDLKNNKIHFTEVYIPNKIKIGQRNNQISSITIRIISLNPKASYLQIHKLISKINISVCEPPLTTNEISTICKKLYSKRESLIPIPNKTRRFFFKDNKIDNTSKKRLIMTYINKDKSINTMNKINDALKILLKRNLKFKISELISLSKCCRNSIKKYLSEILQNYSDLELGINKDFLQNKINTWKN